MLLLGIDRAGNAASLDLGQEPIQHRGRYDSFAVVGDEHRRRVGKRALDAPPQLVDHGGCGRFAGFLVGAQDLLVVRDDARLERGAACGIGEHPRVRVHFARVELSPQALGRGVGPRDSDQDGRRPERANVVGHVGRSAQAKLLALHVDHQHGRFGGNARGAAPEVAVEDHVSDHDHAAAAEAPDARLESRAGKKRRGLCRELSSSNRGQAVSSGGPCSGVAAE